MGWRIPWLLVWLLGACGGAEGAARDARDVVDAADLASDAASEVGPDGQGDVAPEPDVALDVHSDGALDTAEDGHADAALDTADAVEADTTPDSGDASDVGLDAAEEVEADATPDTHPDAGVDPDGEPDLVASEDVAADPDVSDASADAAPPADTRPPDTADSLELGADAAPDAEVDDEVAPDVTADTTTETWVDTPPEVADTTPDVATDAGPDVSDPCPEPCARGRVLFERRRPNPTATQLLAMEASPLRDHPVALLTASGPVHGRTDTDGAFAIALAPTTSLPVTLVVAAETGAPVGDASAVAVFDADGISLPTSPGVVVPVTRLWAWSFELASLAEADHLVTAAAGSGALAALEVLREARALVMDAFGEDEVPTLGVVWNPNKTWSCLSCYLPGSYGPLVHTAAGTSTAYDRAMFLSGTSAAPHHWTPSLITHELGHWVMDVFSRLPSSGGAHGWDQRVRPELAWSEGYATFFGQWVLRHTTSAPSRFFTMQQNIQYWVDIEAIGRLPTTDDTNLAFTIPLPLPNGGIDQTINEAVIAAILWDLFDASPMSTDTDTAALDELALTLSGERRLAGPGYLDRGAPGPDLVDYLDALACAGALPEASALASTLLGFPWDAAWTCPLP